MSNKGLISRIYKELLQAQKQIDKQPNFKMGKGFEQTFLQRRHTNDQ